MARVFGHGSRALRESRTRSRMLIRIVEETLNQERQGRIQVERKLRKSLAQLRHTPRAGAQGTKALEPTTRLTDTLTLGRPGKIDGFDADWRDWRFVTTLLLHSMEVQIYLKE
eukprot:2055963-Amphidinium_carterae.1